MKQNLRLQPLIQTPSFSVPFGSEKAPSWNRSVTKNLDCLEILTTPLRKQTFRPGSLQLVFS